MRPFWYAADFLARMAPADRAVVEPIVLPEIGPPP
jgi:hypothetical protein